MTSRRTLINLAVFVGVFVLLCAWAASNIITIDRLEKPYAISADFPVASGVQPNAEVTYLGVHYGRVTKVTRAPEGFVHMDLKIDRGRYLPLGSTASIFRKSAVGEPYIDFTPPQGYQAQEVAKADSIPPGGKVPVTDTRIPLEFSELLKSASAVLHNIDSAKAGSLVHELAVGLNGRGDDLRAITTAFDQLSATFAAKTTVLDRLAVNNTAITKVLADHAGDLGSSLTNLRLLADSLANANTNTATLLDKGTELIGRVASLVAASKTNLDCTLKALTDLTRLSVQHVDGLDELLTIGPAAFAKLYTTQDVDPDGPWARVNLMTNPNNPPKQYARPLELPPVPVVPACVGTVSATKGVDFVPSQVLSSSSSGGGGLGRLPETGGVFVLGLVTVLMAVALGTRWIGRAGRA